MIAEGICEGSETVEREMRVHEPAPMPSMPNPELAISSKEVMKLAIEDRVMVGISVYVLTVGSVHGFTCRLTGFLEEV